MHGLEHVLRRPIGVLAWSVALVLVGAWAAAHIPVEWVPQVELPEVRIHAAWHGASPKAVERYVTSPIEQAVEAVPGTERVESLSQEGIATVILAVSDDTDLGVYVAEVSEQLALLRRTLPPGVHPRLTKTVPEALRDEQGFMTVQLVGPGSPDVLRSLAEEHLAPRLRSLQGIADVRVEGGTERELYVGLKADRMAAHGIGAATVLGKLWEATEDHTYGRFRERGRDLFLMAPAEDRVETLRDLVLDEPGGVQAPASRFEVSTGPPAAAVDAAPRQAPSPLRLRDVADVRLGPAPVRSVSRVDGQSVVTLTVERARGSHLLDVADAVRHRLAVLEAVLPAHTRLLVADDRSEAVRDQLHDLRWRGGLGLLFVILVLVGMLKSVRATAVVLFTVAVPLAFAITLMGLFGQTLNLLTLAGLVLVFGLLVDNAVVVVEQLVLQQERGGWNGAPGSHGLRAARSALRAVWLPLVGGTLTTVAVMLPLVYLSGELRSLFLPFGILISLTLAASLASAALLPPVLGRFLAPPEPMGPPARRRSRPWRRRIDAPFRLVSRYPRLALLGLALLVGVPVWVLPPQIIQREEDTTSPVFRLVRLYNETIGAEPVKALRSVLDPALGGVLRPFVRKVEFGRRWSFETRPEIQVVLRFPPGNPIGRADSLMRRFEATALASPAVERAIARITEEQAVLHVRFTEAALRTPQPFVVREALIGDAAALSGIDVSVFGLLPEGYHSQAGRGIAGLVVEAYAPAYEEIEAVAERLAERLKRRSHRVAGVDVNADRFGWDVSREVLRFRWPASAEMRTGTPTAAVALHLRPMLTGHHPAFHAGVAGIPHLPVRVAYVEAESQDVASLVERPMRLDDTTRVVLAGLAPFQIVSTPPVILRYDQQYKRYIRVDFRGPDRVAEELIRDEIARMDLPPGHRLEFRPGVFFDEETRRGFGWSIAAALFIVFLVTAAVFESWRLPLVVMVSVPSALAGVAVGFLLTEAPFAEGAFIGCILLAGIAVNDSILLVDRYRQLRSRRTGVGRDRLIRLAIRDRLRPMWTTTLTSVAGMIPLLLFPDGGDFWMGLAVVVTSGLGASTLLSPLVTVALVSCRRDPVL